MSEMNLKNKVTEKVNNIDMFDVATTINDAANTVAIGGVAATLIGAFCKFPAVKTAGTIVMSASILASSLTDVVINKKVDEMCEDDIDDMLDELDDEEEFDDDLDDLDFDYHDNNKNEVDDFDDSLCYSSEDPGVLQKFEQREAETNEEESNS